jgi:hypothetical protein
MTLTCLPSALRGISGTANCAGRRGAADKADRIVPVVIVLVQQDIAQQLTHPLRVNRGLYRGRDSSRQPATMRSASAPPTS